MGKRTGACLRHYRLRAGLRGAGVADLLGVSRPYVSMVEAGDRDLAITAAVQWAKALGAPVEAAVEAVLQDEVDAAGLRLMVRLGRPPGS